MPSTRERGRRGRNDVEMTRLLQLAHAPISAASPAVSLSVWLTYNANVCMLLASRRDSMNAPPFWNGQEVPPPGP
jgi:hypothetical protein